VAAKPKAESASFEPQHNKKPPAPTAQQLAASVQADGRLVSNVRDVYRRTSRALHRRQEGYQSLFDNVQKHVSNKFMAYMMRRKHQVGETFLGLISVAIWVKCF